MSNFRPNNAHVVLTEWTRDVPVTVTIESGGKIIDFISGGRLLNVHVCDSDIVKIACPRPLRAGDTICNVREVSGGVVSSTIKTTVSAVDTRGTHVKKFVITGDNKNSTHVSHATL